MNREQKVIEREQVEVDPQYQEIKEEALGLLTPNAIEVLIPVVMENKVSALIGIGKKENLQAYTLKDIELLGKMGQQVGITIDNALHHGDIVEKERLAEEMKLGREIQMALLPTEAPQIEGLKLTGLMVPAKEIGGDYYDYIMQSHVTSRTAQVKTETNKELQTASRLGIVIGDVSGKGVAAGLIMATAKATLKGLSGQEMSPKEILARANSLLHEYTKGEKFMTMLYLEWDNLQKKLNYSSAGHEHIIIYRSANGISHMAYGKNEKDNESNASAISHTPSAISEPDSISHKPKAISDETGTVEVIQSGGFMLGMLPDIQEMLEDHSIQLYPGDKVVLYTDGVTEARNPQEELYSLERLTDSVKKHGHEPLEELIKGVKDEVYSFIGTQAQYDDITLVMMEAIEE